MIFWIVTHVSACDSTVNGNRNTPSECIPTHGAFSQNDSGALANPLKCNSGESSL